MSYCTRKCVIALTVFLVSVCITAPLLYAQSLNLPTNRYGISFGNSRNFTGLRFNVIDRDVEEIKGINVTFWRSDENKEARVTGISLGFYSPEAGNLTGIQAGGIVAAHQQLKGISFGLLAAGAEDECRGITIGGIAAGAGDSAHGIMIGGLAAGAGDSGKGIMIGGLAAGAGDNFTGFAAGLLAAGAGDSGKGIMIGGLASGAGDSFTGLSAGLLASGAGDSAHGIMIGGLAAGAGDSATGITIGGIFAGAGDSLYGLTIGGLAAGSQDITGITLALGIVKAVNDGSMNGFSASAFNHIKGRQHGVTLGIVNYAHELNGIQLGVINYVRDNPLMWRVLPLVNAHFD